MPLTGNLTGDRWALDRAIVVFLPRALLGLIYLYAGIHKLTDAGLAAFIASGTTSDAVRFVPVWLVSAIAAVTPFVELALGGLLCLGLRTRTSLRVLAVLILCVAAVWGVHGLLHPRGVTAMDIDVVDLYILPRAVLIVGLLLLPRDGDVLSLDHLLRRKSAPHPHVAMPS